MPEFPQDQLMDGNSEMNKLKVTLTFTDIGIEVDIPPGVPDEALPKHCQFAIAMAHWAGTREAVKIIGEFAGKQRAERERQAREPGEW